MPLLTIASVINLLIPLAILTTCAVGVKFVEMGVFTAIGFRQRSRECRSWNRAMSRIKW